MKATRFLIICWALTLVRAVAGVSIDEDSFAKSLGGWKKANVYADYTISGASYRTYKPEISPTPDGGIFVSVRIDHLRGWLSSDDHAGLEITVNSKGVIVSAQSTIAIQGLSIASDLIRSSNEAGKEVLGPDHGVKVGTDLISNLSAKLMRENIVEAGRVSFPSALRHNYNLLFQSIRVEAVAVPVATVIDNQPVVPPPPVPPAPPEPVKTEAKPEPKPEAEKPEPKKDDKPEKPADKPDPVAKPLEIGPFTGKAGELPK